MIPDLTQTSNVYSYGQPVYNAQVAEEQHAIDTPVTRLEKQMKHDAGMEDSDDHSSQWRAVARHVITGQDLGTADKGFKSEGFGSRSSVKEVKRALELGLEEVSSLGISSILEMQRVLQISFVEYIPILVCDRASSLIFQVYWNARFS